MKKILNNILNRILLFGVCLLILITIIFCIAVVLIGICLFIPVAIVLIIWALIKIAFTGLP